MTEKRKTVQFHTTINKSLLNNFRELCRSYNIPASAGVKILIKNSIKKAQLPGMQKHVKISSFFKKYSALPKTFQKLNLIINHLKYVDNLVIPNNNFYDRISKLYLNIWLINADILTKVYGKEYKVLPGAPIDDTISRLLTEAWILSGNNSKKFMYQCRLLLKSHDKKLLNNLEFNYELLNRIVPQKTLDIVVKPNVRGILYLAIAHRNMGLYSICRYSSQDYIRMYRKVLHYTKK